MSRPYMSSADECGWRRYPPSGTFRVVSTSHEYYQEADIAEAIINTKCDYSKLFLLQAVNQSLEFGTGYARWWPR